MEGVDLMARIRSIKPEFWTSEQVMNLPPLARLVFIGMWTHSDDGGNHPASARTLKAQIFPSDDFTAAQVQEFVDAIVAQGLAQVYEVAGKTYWHITGWAKHQRIEKPTYRHPKPLDSAPPPQPVVEQSSNPPLPVTDSSPPEWSGVGIGVGIGDVATPAGAAPKPPATKPKTVKASKSTPVWSAYSQAYSKRYGVAPVGSAKANSQLCQLVDLIGADDAVAVATFFLGCEDRFYVGAYHPIDVLLKDCQKLRTQWATSGQRSATDQPQWVLDAGFANVHEARNERCFEHNAHEFRNGTRVEVAA